VAGAYSEPENVGFGYSSAMHARWGVLGLVVLARTTVGFQFQSVAAVGPFLVADLGLSYAELGTLIGLYLLPGVVLALPGGMLGTRFGDRVVVLAALGLMTAGGIAVGAAGSWLPVAGGRLASGAGAVLLNMQLAKIVTDRFVGRELATALGFMLISWPFGIWLGLATLGALAAATTWRAAMLVTTLSAALAFGLMLCLYREPSAAPGGSRAERRWWTITGWETVLTAVAGLAWASLNAGLMLFLSFAPKLLLERGATPSAANLAVGWASFLGAATVPLGGALLDRVRRRDAVVAVGLGGTAAACGAFALGGPATLWSVLVGLLIAPVAGVVALPGEVLSARSRSTGFGLFYTLFYAGMGVAPVVAGSLVDRSGGAAALWLAATLLLAPIPSLPVFRAMQRGRVPARSVAP
jgi:predicted MFS family arabinose efflux permease